MVQPLGEEVEAVAGPGAQGEDGGVVVEVGFQEGDLVLQELLVDGEAVAWRAALEADDGALEEAVGVE